MCAYKQSKLADTTRKRKHTIRARIGANHKTLIDTLDSLANDQWATPVYNAEEPNVWTVQSVVAHLAKSAIALLRTAQNVASGKDQVPPNFNLARWNSRMVEQSAHLSHNTLVQEIRTSYEQWIAFLENIAGEDLKRTGRHPSGQTLSVEEMFTVYARHEANHAADIRSALDK